MPIQWFPGHMAKAKREIQEVLPLVDIAIELRDARIPYSSKNPMVDDILKNKPRLILLNKSTLADPKETKEWIKKLTSDNTKCLDIDAISGYNMKKIFSSIEEVLHDKLLKLKEKGLTNKSIRALVLGIPNVGKSTFINFMARKKVAKTGDKPGVTKVNSWLKITDNLMFLDTPGILWPKFESEDVGIKLSLCGSIKDEVVDLEKVAIEGIDYLKKNYPNLLQKRYNLEEDLGDLDKLEVIEHIAKKRGCVLKGNEVDYERVYTLFINDLRNNRIGAISFEKAREEY